VQSRYYATTARWTDIPGSFLGNGSVNTFPQQQTQRQQQKSCIFYVVRAEMQGTRLELREFYTGVYEERI
jgi:hypothetical protein